MQNCNYNELENIVNNFTKKTVPENLQNVVLFQKYDLYACGAINCLYFKFSTKCL